MGLMQRQKGKRHEREVAKAFRVAVPDAKRGYQSRGGGKEAPDVEIPHLHLECKHKKTVSIWAAMKQAEEDCPPGKVPAAVVRENRRPDLVVMNLHQFVELFGEVLRARAKAVIQAEMGRATCAEYLKRATQGLVNEGDAVVTEPMTLSRNTLFNSLTFEGNGSIDANGHQVTVLNGPVDITRIHSGPKAPR